MIYLQTQKIEELKNKDKVKLEKYENEYLRFFNEISPEITDYKKYDEAMWAFGKFLKQNRLKSL
jgi:guanylate kinase